MKKFDMHCHTKEGSIDASVPIDEFIQTLIDRGYGGMLISDHDSYNGYREWKRNIKGKKYQDFVVLKGIEYDTVDAGHILVIMPENVKLRILECRGLSVARLIHIVHKHGGILGPAHPCGEKYLSFITTKQHSRYLFALVRKFDFMEVFNASEPPISNVKAFGWASTFQLPGFGGSDAHKKDCIGLGYAKLPKTIKTESDLIAFVRDRPVIDCGGVRYGKTLKDKMGKWNKILVYAFFVYNKVLSLAKTKKRRNEIGHVQYVDDRKKNSKQKYV